MKTPSFPDLTAALTAMLLAPAWAIEAPADNAPPPPAAATTPRKAVAGMLAEHLKLPAGEGIVVQALMPDGPAAKAGVAVHDIITHVADQAVGSGADLTRQVAAHQPGATIHLKVIHKGQAAGLDVTLGTRPDSVSVLEPGPLDQLNLDGIPKELADRVRDAIQGNLGGMDLNADPNAAADAPELQEAMREMKKRMQNAMEGLKAPDAAGQPKIEVQQGAAIRLMDEQGSIEMKSNEGGKEVTIRDKANKVTWSGAWDTEQDKAAAPEDVRQRVERLHIDSKYQGNGLRLRFPGQGRPNE